MRLPTWLADGPDVTELAYAVIETTLERAGELTGDENERASISEVVSYLVCELGADEADVLEALAELQRAGVIGGVR